MKHVYKDPGIHLIFTKTKNTPIVNVPHSNPGRFTHARQHTHNDADGQRNHCQFSQQVTMKVRFVFQHGLLSIKIYAATSHWRQASFSPEKWSNNSRRRCVQAPAIQHQLIYTGKTINKKGANSSPRSESSDQGRWVKPTAFHKKWSNLGKGWDPSSNETVVNISKKPDKAQELIGLITDNKEIQDIVQTIYSQDQFPFTYNIFEETGVKGDYPDPGFKAPDYIKNLL